MLKPGLDIEFRRPSPAPARIHRRFLLLAAIACRSELGAHADDPAARDIDRQVGGWLDAEGLWADAEPADTPGLKAPLAEVPPLTGVMATEGAAVLAWALGRGTLRALHEATDIHDVAQSLGWLEEGCVPQAGPLHWRPRTDWLRLAELLDVAHFALEDEGDSVRLTHFAEDRLRPPPDVEPLSIHPAGGLMLPVIGGSTGTQTSGLALIRLRLAARRQALGWVLGQSEDYASADL
jgi:hypothetical protein